MQEQVGPGLQAMSERLLVADPNREPPVVVLRRNEQLCLKNRISFAQQRELYVAFKHDVQCVIDNIGHLLVGNPAEAYNQRDIRI